MPAEVLDLPCTLWPPVPIRPGAFASEAVQGTRPDAAHKLLYVALCRRDSFPPRVWRGEEIVSFIPVSLSGRERIS